MIEPRVTAVSGRRYLALLIDSALVAAVGFLVAYLMSEEFSIVGRDDTGDPLVDPAEFGRMQELLDFEIFGQSEILGVNLVRAQELGGSVRVFGADSYQWGLVAAALAALIVFYTIPAIAQRTIGMIPFGLEIRDIDGGRPTVSAHLKRSVAGVIDMIPGIVPGLVGTVVASFSTHQQRIGDRLAGTVVVDRKLAGFYISEQKAEPLTLLVEEEIVSEPASTAAESAAEEQQTELTGRTERSAAALDVQAPRTTEGVASERPLPIDTAPKPTEVKPTLPLDVEDAPLPPPPVHRKPPSDRPRSAAAGSPSTEGDQATLDALDPAPTSAGDSDDGPTPESIDGAWEAPRVEPAPVWQPSPLDPAPIETPRPDDARSLDEVLAGRPKVSELISADPVSSDSSPNPGADGGATERAGQRSASTRAPVWSDKWRAWMYWDPNNKRWLRHDTATGTWIPAD